MWNCPKSSCHGAFPDTRNPLEASCVKNSPFLRGTRGVVLLRSWVWKDVNGWALEIGISYTYSNPVITGGQKHTHTHCRWWLTAIPLEDAEINKPGCVQETRDQPGPVENRNEDGAPCPTPLLAYQGNNSAMYCQLLVFSNYMMECQG